MINRANDTSKMTFPQEVTAFIPTSWKLIDLVFRSIAQGHYADFTKPPFPVDEDGIVLGSDIMDVDFHEASVSLFIDSCQRCSRRLPYELYELESPGLVIDAIRTVAQDISENYSVARQYIADSDVLELFDKIDENCNLIDRLIGYVPEVDKYGGFIYQGLEFFSHLDMKPWFKILNGTCLEELDYNTFAHTINCEGEFDLVDDNGGIQHQDYRNSVLTPLIDYGMVIYAFVLLLMNKRSTHSPRNWAWDSDGEEYQNKKFWAVEFSKRINWDNELYYVKEDNWKEAYVSGGIITATEVVSEEEKLLIQELQDRGAFEEIVSLRFMDKLLRPCTMGITYAQYLDIHRSTEERLTQLKEALAKELTYLYSSIEDTSALFMDKNAAEDAQYSSKLDYENKLRNDKYIEVQFSNLAHFNAETVHRVFFNNNLFRNIYIWEQPLVYSECVHKFIEGCIIQDEALSQIVFRKLCDGDFRQPQPTDSKKEEDQSMEKSFLEDMKSVLSENHENKGTYEIKGTISAFVRMLVAKGYVQTYADWKTVFSIERNKELFNTNSHKNVEDDELQQITRKLNWREYDNMFIHKGIRLSWKRLQQAFSDGDIRRINRVDSLRALYGRVMTE